ncbi:TetR/AcrR family transcriptional regulator [Nocardia sp. CC201C]|uniref:TetR family transcriptional regulator n=1 Tax=Nocardia sp. CC201C TaxID=3044575 RepID=UPI0024A7E37E|nr:TetR/AcrR family transcriptional regulator [Nocardia sp. CC201C]
MGKGICSPVYIDDLVDGILLPVASPPAAGKVFTLTDGVGVTCTEFFGHYYTMLGMPPKARHSWSEHAMPTKATARQRRPTQQRALDTRQLILDTSANLFGQRGIVNTSTNRIVAETGISIGTVYRHFPDRTVIAHEHAPTDRTPMSGPLGL